MKNGGPMIDEALFGKGLCKDVFQYIVVLLLILVSLYGFRMMGTEQQGNESPKMLENQVDIFSPDSTVGEELLSEGAIPISALEILNEEKSYSERIAILKSASENAKTLPVNHGLNLSSDKNYDVYELEFYITGEEQYVDTLEKYKELRGISSDVNVNTEKYFIYPGQDTDLTGEGYELSTNYFVKTVSEIKASCEREGAEAECTYLTIALKDGATIQEVISSGKLKGVSDGNYYVASSLILKTNSELMRIQAYRSAVQFLIALAVLFIVIDLFAFCIVMKRNKKLVTIYKDIGVAKEVLFGLIKRNYIRVRVYIAACAAVTIATMIMILVSKTEMQLANFMNVAVLFVAVIVDATGRKTLIKALLNKNYRWNSR